MTQVEEEASPSFYVRQDDADEKHRNDTTDTTSSPTTVPQHHSHPGDQTPSSQLPQYEPSARKSIKSFRYQLKSFGALALPYFRESSQGRWAFFWLVIDKLQGREQHLNFGMISCRPLFGQMLVATPFRHRRVKMASDEEVHQFLPVPYPHHPWRMLVLPWS